MLKSVNNELRSINWGNLLGEVRKIEVWSLSALMMAGRFVQIFHFGLLSHGLSGLNIIHTMSFLYICLFLHVYMCDLDCLAFLLLNDWFRVGENRRDSLAGKWIWHSGMPWVELFCRCLFGSLLKRLIISREWRSHSDCAFHSEAYVFHLHGHDSTHDP